MKKTRKAETRLKRSRGDNLSISLKPHGLLAGIGYITCTCTYGFSWSWSNDSAACKCETAANETAINGIKYFMIGVSS